MKSFPFFTYTDTMLLSMLLCHSFPDTIHTLYTYAEFDHLQKICAAVDCSRWCSNVTQGPWQTIAAERLLIGKGGLLGQLMAWLPTGCG